MKSQKAFLSQALTDDSISAVYLPPVPAADLPAGEVIACRIAHAVCRCVPALRHTIRELSGSNRLVALIVSYVGTDAFTVAEEFGLLKYVFSPTAAMIVSLFQYLPELDSICTCQYKDLPEKVKIPGCIPVFGSELPDWLEDRQSGIYKCLLYNVKR